MIALIYVFKKIVQFCLRKLENIVERNEERNHAIDELSEVTYENAEPTFIVMQNIDVIDDIISDFVLQEQQRAQSSLRRVFEFNPSDCQLDAVRNRDSSLRIQERSDLPPTYENA